VKVENGNYRPTASNMLTFVVNPELKAPVATATVVKTQLEIVTVNGKVYVIDEYETRLAISPI